MAGSDMTVLDKRNEKFSALIDDELGRSELEEMVSALCLDGEGLAEEGSDNGSGETGSEKNSDLKKKWQRYHIISDALQKHLPEKMDYCLADRVMSELKNDPVILAPNRISAVAQDTQTDTKNTAMPPSVSPPASRQIFKQIAGLAVAASVMVVAILVSQTFSTNDGVNPNPVAPPIATLSPTAPPAISPTTPPAMLAKQPSVMISKQPVMPSKQQFARMSEPQTALPPSFQNQLNRYLANHNQYASGVSGVLPYARIIGHISNPSNQPQTRFQPQSNSQRK